MRIVEHVFGKRRSSSDGPAALLTSIATSGATAFLIVMAMMTLGLILPRVLFERVLPAPA